MPAVSPMETPCPDCGEMVRKNALRCWNCGAFMSQDVQAKFLELQANPAPMIFSQLPADEISAFEVSDDEDDFQLTVPNPVVKTTPLGAQPKQFSTAPVTVAIDVMPANPVAEIPPETPVQTPPVSESKASRVGGHDDSSVPHSVATGGDALFDIAMSEEAEARKRKKKRPAVTGGMRTPGGGLIIFCPYGCKIEVKEQHRGMQGKCPKCQAPFIVPIDPPQFKKARSEESGAPESLAGAFTVWLPDLHLHAVSVEKLKLKADSLAKEFVEMDFGFSDDTLLVANLQKKAGGLFAAASGKKDDVRAAMYAHLKAGNPLADLPVGEKFAFTKVDLQQLKVVQPAASRGDNIFHGVPVFGAGRIGIQLPITDQSKDPLFVSLGIIDFWELRKTLQNKFGIHAFGNEAGLPGEPVYKDYRCHYTDTRIRALEHIELYKADPKAETVVAGYKCGACGLTVSEAGRAKENLGGKGGKGIGKTKCPKCSNKMGENLLYSMKKDVEEPTMSGAPAPSQTPAS